VVWAGKPHRITSVSLRAAAADLLHPACTAEFELLSHKPGKKKKNTKTNLLSVNQKMIIDSSIFSIGLPLHIFKRYT
jgi:hypothetical protein